MMTWPDDFAAMADAAVSAARGRMNVYLVANPAADVSSTVLPVIRDTAGAFATAFGVAGAVFVVRPDGYVGFTSNDLGGSGIEALRRHPCNTFA